MIKHLNTHIDTGEKQIPKPWRISLSKVPVTLPSIYLTKAFSHVCKNRLNQTSVPKTKVLGQWGARDVSSFDKLIVGKPAWRLVRDSHGSEHQKPLDDAMSTLPSPLSIFSFLFLLEISHFGEVGNDSVETGTFSLVTMIPPAPLSSLPACEGDVTRVQTSAY